MAEENAGIHKLKAENAELKLQLSECQETLRAIQTGTVDALVMQSPSGDQIYTLKDAEHPYRVAVETMTEGTATLTSDSTVFYCNNQLASLLKASLSEIMGKPLANFIIPSQLTAFRSLLKRARKGTSRCEVELKSAEGTSIPVLMSARSLTGESRRMLILIVTDLSEHKRTEQIVASERFARVVLDQAANAIIVFDSEGTIIRASEKAHQLLGVGLEGGQFDRVFNQFYVVSHNSKTGAQGRAGKPVKTSAISRDEIPAGSEIVLAVNGNAERYFLFNSNPLVEENDVLGYSVSLTDITEQKEAEKEKTRLLEELKIHEIELQSQAKDLRQAQKEANQFGDKYLDLYNNAPVAYLNLKDGIIQEANQIAAQLLGVEAKSLFKTRFSEFIVKDSLGPFYDHLMRSLKTGTHQTCEIQLQRTDKTQLSAKLDSIAIKIPQCNLYQSRITISDITERKQDEEALRQTRDYLDNLLNYANAPIIVWSPDLKITQFNHAFERLTGKLAPDVLNKSIDILFPEYLREHSMEYIRQTMSGERWEIVEIPILRSDSSVRTVLWNSSNIHNSDGRIMATIAQGQDITERKTAEEALRKYAQDLEAANKDLEAFGYSVTHDMKQPLRALGTFSELLYEDYKDKLDDNGKDYVERIRKASLFISELTEDMLKLSRVTRSEMTREPVDLSAIAQSTLEEFKANQPLRQVEIKIAPELMVSGDKQLLTVALRNLLENAWKFTLKCQIANIELGSMEKDEARVYYIRDNGIGFDMRYKDKLFQPFQRLTTDKDYPGTGIGLAIVQRVIRRHGGRIWAEAEVGKGVTFYFALA
jgi:PAS domain S-box-containing protein